jgi:hypothetical protein
MNTKDLESNRIFLLTTATWCFISSIITITKINRLKPERFSLKTILTYHHRTSRISEHIFVLDYDPHNEFHLVDIRPHLKYPTEILSFHSLIFFQYKISNAACSCVEIINIIFVCAFSDILLPPTDSEKTIFFLTSCASV